MFIQVTECTTPVIKLLKGNYMYYNRQEVLIIHS